MKIQEKLFQEKIVLFTGNFGSGKTELAMQYAKNCSNAGRETVLVDLDVVNPYFTSAIQKEVLQQQNIQIIAPQYSGTGVDTPSISAAVQSIFYNEKYNVIDLGGDPTGATVLARYAKELETKPYQLLFVLNSMRPFTQDVAGAYQMFQDIQSKLKVPITGIVNNSNLSFETTQEYLMAGNVVAKELSEKAKVPVVYHSGKKEILNFLIENKIPLEGAPFVLDPQNHPTWQNEKDASDSNLF